MDSSLLRKMLKARIYAEEPDRVTVTSWTAVFRGDNATHTITYRAPDAAPGDSDAGGDGSWTCTCEYFGRRDTCSHLMAAQDMRPVMVRLHRRSRTPSLIPLGSAG